MTVGHFDTKKYSYSVSPFPRLIILIFFTPPLNLILSHPHLTSPPSQSLPATRSPRLAAPRRLPSLPTIPSLVPLERNEWTRPLRFRSRRDAVIVSSIVPVPPHPPVSTSTFPCMLHCLISFPVLSRPSLFFLPCPYPPFVTARTADPFQLSLMSAANCC